MQYELTFAIKMPEKFPTNRERLECLYWAVDFFVYCGDLVEEVSQVESIGREGRQDILTDEVKVPEGLKAHI
jgi:hypothetical protein